REAVPHAGRHAWLPLEPVTNVHSAHSSSDPTLEGIAVKIDRCSGKGRVVVEVSGHVLDRRLGLHKPIALHCELIASVDMTTVTIDPRVTDTIPCELEIEQGIGVVHRQEVGHEQGIEVEAPVEIGRVDTGRATLEIRTGRRVEASFRAQITGCDNEDPSRWPSAAAGPIQARLEAVDALVIAYAKPCAADGIERVTPAP